MSSLPDFLSPAHYGWIVAANHDPVRGRWEFWIDHKGTRRYLSCTDIMPSKDIFEACVQTRNEIAREQQIAQAVKKRLLS